MSAVSNAYWAADFASNYVISITRRHPRDLETNAASYQFSHGLTHSSSLIFTEPFCGYAVIG